MAVIPLQSGVFAGPGADVAFLIGRVVFGVVLAVMGLNHFTNAETMAGYAGSKGLPAPSLLVVFSGGMLIFGGLGIALGVFPTLAAGALVVFLAVTTPVMHDFWAAPEDQQQSETINFLKNTALLGVALALLALSQTPWPYAVGIGL